MPAIHITRQPDDSATYETFPPGGDVNPYAAAAMEAMYHDARELNAQREADYLQRNGRPINPYQR